MSAVTAPLAPVSAVSPPVVSAASLTVPAPPVAIPAPEAAIAPPKISVEAYLAQERDSEVRHEYFKGEITEMAGETPRHNRIALNSSICFDNAFGNRDCAVYIAGVRLRVSPEQYRYPDVIALCAPPQFDDGNPPCLLNPEVIIEVLSASTEGKDRGEKFAEYRDIATLTDYVIVAQDKIFVEHCVRQGPAQWLLTEYKSLDDTLNFAALGVTISLREMYRKTPLAAPLESAPANHA